MDFGEHLRRLEENPVSLTSQQRAQELIAEFRAPLRIDRVNEAPSSTIVSLGRDIVDLTTGLSLRIRAYRLNRALGLTTVQSLRHSSPAEGLASAALVAPAEDSH